MDSQQISLLHQSFDGLAQRHPDGDVEFWYARELMTVLGYSDWRNFLRAIDDARQACQQADGTVENHFVDATKMVFIGSGAQREVEDIILTRYACYLIAQNGDPRKPEIAFAQTYFALQTRRQELLEERIRLQERLQARERLKESETALSRNLYERGVDAEGFARIRSKGDSALFGGKATQAMKKQLAVPGNRPLADFLPTVTIAAKNLATEMTNHNVTSSDLQGEAPISKEHVQNNESVRRMLVGRGIAPEKLPAAEDLKKLERRVRSAETKMIKGTELPGGAGEEGGGV